MLVRARFPALFAAKGAMEDIGPQGLLCLPRSLEIKKELIKRLIEVDMPLVVQEIETARGHGDLKENAEYHAAKDKQKLLASQVSDLQESLSSPLAIRLEEVEADEIKFGTVFSVQPAAGETTEEYIMLGPWESDPDRNILSYQAPLAQFFTGKKVDEFVDVELPNFTGRFEIKSIAPLTEQRVEDLNIFEKVAQIDFELALSDTSPEGEPDVAEAVEEG
jgi:transcription elongation factor GreA